VTRARSLLALAPLLALSLAPVAGDVGSCGSPAVDLDPAKFFALEYGIQCKKCLGCGIDTARCAELCAGPPEGAAFPLACFPTVHDGEVCIRALDAAGCDEMALYVADEGAVIASECDFCPESANPNVGGAGGSSGAGGAGGSP
jgi:hypothetical protein